MGEAHRKGVEILGHARTVLCYPINTCPQINDGTNHNFTFMCPKFGFDGMSELASDLQEANISTQNYAKPIGFHDYFPYQVSPDGNKARVGLSLGWWGTARFDIEVRKVEGRWLPVQCRLVELADRRGWSAVAPIRNQDIR